MARSAYQLQNSTRGNGGITPSSDMPITGKFGTGQVKIFGTPGVYPFIVPLGITSIRSRLFGGGSNQNTVQGTLNGEYYTYYHVAGSGGGFSLKVNDNLTPLSTIMVTVAGPGQTSSFGSFHSATGGEVGTISTLKARRGGVGIGGDINWRGGNGGLAISGTSSSGAGGSANLLGDGGDGGGYDNGYSGYPGTSGGGGGTVGNAQYAGGSGFAGYGGAGGNFSFGGAGGTSFSTSIDHLGCGAGGGGTSSGANGGGGGSSAKGGWPGGGHATDAANYGPGLIGGAVILEF